VKALEEGDWEYCQVEFSIWYDPLTGGEGVAIQQNGWLRFYGKVIGTGGSYVAGKSRDVPVVRQIGSSAIPDRNNPLHQSLHLEFVHSLIEAGWQLLPDRDDRWWARRLRRKVDKSRRV
jgi:hypothetical protein